MKKKDLDAARERAELLERKIILQEDLPFLYGWKWYPWARKFYESTNRINLLCAANQISKSSTQIRKCLNWATNKELWPTLWARPPKQFWYMYPTSQQATTEFETKWQEQLPGPRMKEDPIYGWKVEYKNKEVTAIRFNSGVILYFKTYSQKTSSLQTSTVEAIFCDEEIPVEYYDELMFRTAAVRGYFSMVFTATLGGDFWRRALQPTKHEEETLVGALKIQVSMFDCLKYDDGSRSHWTEADINRIIGQCKSQAEVDRRVFGKFVVDVGRRYPTFEPAKHMLEQHPYPKNWAVYVGVDSGSGGNKNHPAAICFVAVNPEHTKGRVVAGWRGDKIETTSSDVLQKLREIKQDLRITPTMQFYDWADKDFEIIAGRIGEGLAPADKSREKGEKIINTLFKNDMLAIYTTDETHKLASELLGLRVDIPKNKAKDDFIDALRYAVSSIPWNWELGIKDIPPEEKEKKKDMTNEEWDLARRKGEIGSFIGQGTDSILQEFNEWNDLYGA